MKLFIKPFLAWIKKAVELNIDADITEATLTLAITVALAGKVLFEEQWSWELPDAAIEHDPDVMEVIQPPGQAFHRVAPVRLPKLRINPRKLPRLSKQAAFITERKLR